MSNATRLFISYLSDAFPPQANVPSIGQLDTSWSEILWSAITIGRPNRSAVFQHGASSTYEAIFRMALVRSALESNGYFSPHLTFTGSYCTLDPSEKGAVNYFLGMTFCKLFATRLLDTPWLLHLDVWRPELDPVLTGRSRPDLVGQQRGTANWLAFECKGRSSSISQREKDKAKVQAQRLISVGGVPCSMHIGALSYPKSDGINFFWRDPVPTEKNPIKLTFDDWIWDEYYRTVRELLASPMANQDGVIEIKGLEIQITVQPEIRKAVLDKQGAFAKVIAEKKQDELIEEGFQPDGIKVSAGPSWGNSFE